MSEVFKALTEHFRATSSVRSVFGDAVSIHDKAVIPVARIVSGFGGGSGIGRPVRPFHGSPDAAADVAPPLQRAEGEGGGGGVVAWPLGVFEVTSDHTRFIPLHPIRQVVWAGALGLGIGFVCGAVFRRSRKSACAE